MQYKILYEALLKEGALPPNYSGEWLDDRDAFIEEQIELEERLLNLETDYEDAEYTD